VPFQAWGSSACALAKAGYATLDALRNATEEDLALVPGISPIKARHIVQHLQQLPVLPQAPAPDAGVRAALLRARNAAQRLLESDRAEDLEKPLLRQLQKVVALAAALPEPPAGQADTGEDLARRIAGTVEALIHGVPGRKRQERTAEDLRAWRKGLKRMGGGG